MKKYFLILLIFNFCCCLHMPKSIALPKKPTDINNMINDSIILSKKILRHITVTIIGTTIAYSTIIATGLILKRLNILSPNIPLTPTQLKLFLGTTIPNSTIKIIMKALANEICPRINKTNSLLVRLSGTKEDLINFLNCHE